MVNKKPDERIKHHQVELKAVRQEMKGQGRWIDVDVGDLSGHITAGRTSTTVDGRFVGDSVRGSWGLTDTMLVLRRPSASIFAYALTNRVFYEVATLFECVVKYTNMGVSEREERGRYGISTLDS